MYRKLPVNVNLDSVWVWFNSHMIVNYHSIAADTWPSLTVCHYLFRKVLLRFNWSFTLFLCFSLRGKLGGHLMFFVQNISCDILIGWSAWVIVLVAHYSLLRHWNRDIEVADLNPSLEDGLPLWHPHPVLCPLPSCNFPPLPNHHPSQPLTPSLLGWWDEYLVLSVAWKSRLHLPYCQQAQREGVKISGHSFIWGCTFCGVDVPFMSN